MNDIKKIIFILLFVFILLSFPAMGYTNYTCSSTYLDESFVYADTFSNHGWTIEDNCPFTPDNHIIDPFYKNISSIIRNESFGHNGTYQCGNGVTVYNTIKRSLTAVSSGEILFKYNFTIWNQTGGDAGMPDFYMRLCKDGTANCFDIRHGTGSGANNYQTVVSDPGGSSWNIEECTSSHNMSYATEYEAMVDMDLDALRYSLYIDKAEVGCTDLSLGVLDEISYIIVQQGYKDQEVSYRETDDILVCTGYLDEIPVSDTYTSDDIDSAITAIENIAGIDTNSERYLIGVILLLFICGGMIYTYYIIGKGEGLGGVIGTVIMGFLVSILITMIGFLPLWIPILWFILGGVGVFFVIKSSMSG